MKFGLLNLPKIAIVLTILVVAFLLLIYALFKLDISWALGTSLFPMVILIFAAENFIKASSSKGYIHATGLALKTLFLSLFCFVIYKSVAFAYVFLVFPELLLCVIAINLSLGTWIGLRMSEIVRFRSIVK
jgi:hypothetical protein